MGRDRLLGARPSVPGAREPVSALGAPPISRTVNPHSRSGLQSPHLQGRVMDHLFIGLDVAKDRLDLHVRPGGEAFSVAHDEPGVIALLDRLRTLAPTLIALEATGGYEATVAATLASAGLPVAVVNPRQIRDFARATGLLAKTDRLDARVIAHFAEAIRPAVRPLPDAQLQHLGELVTRRRQLVEMLGAETNRRRLTQTRPWSAGWTRTSPGSSGPSGTSRRTCTTRSA